VRPHKSSVMSALPGRRPTSVQPHQTTRGANFGRLSEHVEPRGLGPFLSFISVNELTPLPVLAKDRSAAETHSPDFIYWRPPSLLDQG
jgi:hypothetical protein